MSNEKWIAESEIKDLEHVLAGQSVFVKELKAENQRLRDGFHRDGYVSAANYKKLEAVAEAAVALLEPDTDESYPSIDYVKQERCKQLLRLALHAAGYLK